MIQIVDNKGEELAKVLVFYGLLEDTSSKEQKIICPFHGDVNPSMKINLQDGSFYCFGCCAHGDAFGFVKMANPDDDELSAYIKFRKILKSKRVESIKVKKAKAVPREDDQESLDIAHDFYYGLRTTNWRGHLDEDEAYCYKYMKDRGFNSRALNIAKAKITYRKNYPIVFPMLDNGEFKGWVCRTTDSEVAKKRKYLYNKGFSRASTLVGNYSNTDTVVLVEGYMDYLKMRMFGMKKVAAILGWKITNEQIEKLKRQGVKRIISALDNDECGRKGTEYLKKFFEVVRWQYDKGCKDAGDMTRQSFKRMKSKTKIKIKIGAKSRASK